MEQEPADGWEFAGVGGCHRWERLGLCMVLCSHCEHGLICCRFRMENCAGEQQEVAPCHRSPGL